MSRQFCYRAPRLYIPWWLWPFAIMLWVCGLALYAGIWLIAVQIDFVYRKVRAAYVRNQARKQPVA